MATKKDIERYRAEREEVRDWDAADRAVRALVKGRRSTEWKTIAAHIDRPKAKGLVELMLDEMQKETKR